MLASSAGLATRDQPSQGIEVLTSWVRFGMSSSESTWRGGVSKVAYGRKRNTTRSSRRAPLPRAAVPSRRAAVRPSLHRCASSRRRRARSARRCSRRSRPADTSEATGRRGRKGRPSGRAQPPWPWRAPASWRRGSRRRRRRSRRTTLPDRALDGCNRGSRCGCRARTRAVLQCRSRTSSGCEACARHRGGHASSFGVWQPKRSAVTASACASTMSGAWGSIPASRRYSEIASFCSPYVMHKLGRIEHGEYDAELHRTLP